MNSNLIWSPPWIYAYPLIHILLICTYAYIPKMNLIVWNPMHNFIYIFEKLNVYLKLYFLLFKVHLRIQVTLLELESSV